MEKLYSKFNRFYKKFTIKKEYFKKCIEQFASDDSKKDHEIGHRLIEEAERLIDDLQKVTKVKQDLSSEKQKVNRFKKVYLELVEFTKPEWKLWLDAIILAIIVVTVVRSFFFGLYRVPSGSAEPTLLVGDRVLGSKMAYWGDKKPKRGDLVIFDSPVFEYDQYNTFNYLWQKHIGYGVPFLGLSDGPDYLVKRVIAVPGDIIQGRVEGGRTSIYLNGDKIAEPYVNPYPLIALEKRTGFIDLDSIGPIPIPRVIKKASRYPAFYTYVPNLDSADQPYYDMSSQFVGLEPGTHRPWLVMPNTPSKNEYGKIVDSFNPISIKEDEYWVMGDSRKNSKDSRYWGPLKRKFIKGRATVIIYSIDSEEPLWLFELIKQPIKFWTKSMRWKRTLKWLADSYKGVVNNKKEEPNDKES